jgi:hypothetical protein
MKTPSTYDVIAATLVKNPSGFEKVDFAFQDTQGRTTWGSVSNCEKNKRLVAFNVLKSNVENDKNTNQYGYVFWGVEKALRICL